MSGDLDRLEQLLVEGAEAHRSAPDPGRPGRLLAPLRRQRRGARLRALAWALPAAGLLLAVVFFPPGPKAPSPETSASPNAVIAARSPDPAVEDEATPATPTTPDVVDPTPPPELAAEMARLTVDLMAAREFLTNCVPLFSRLLQR